MTRGPYWYHRPDRVIGRALFLIGAWTVLVCGLAWMKLTAAWRGLFFGRRT